MKIRKNKPKNEEEKKGKIGGGGKRRIMKILKGMFASGDPTPCALTTHPFYLQKYFASALYS
jgi:hypothetical protein